MARGRRLGGESEGRLRGRKGRRTDPHGTQGVHPRVLEVLPPRGDRRGNRKVLESPDARKDARRKEMKSTLGLAAILAPALFISAALQCDLTVHEWGTFTPVAGE